MTARSSGRGLELMSGVRSNRQSVSQSGCSQPSGRHHQSVAGDDSRDSKGEDRSQLLLSWCTLGQPQCVTRVTCLSIYRSVRRHAASNSLDLAADFNVAASVAPVTC